MNKNNAKVLVLNIKRVSFTENCMQPTLFWILLTENHTFA